MTRLHTPMGVDVELLSPLHIGTGTELLLDYDVVPHGGQTYRVDEDALFEQALARAEATGAAAVNRVLGGRPARELLTEADYARADSPLFRYVLAGEPAAKTPGAKVREQIKDVYDQLYLPGSSLKGALRTVLAWGFYARQNRRPDLGSLGRSRTWAARRLEGGIFGPNPNRDWLRAVHVGDSEPLEPASRLLLASVRVYPTAAPQTGRGLDIDVEAIRAGTAFHTAMLVDEYGFQREASSRLGWQGKRAWLDRLPALAREHGSQRIEMEVRYFQQKQGPAAALQFYQGLLQTARALAENEFILQLGWGTGWESKTLGSSMLRQDDRAFERLLREYRMTKERQRTPGAPFPKSRHLVLDQRRQPALPLGWVKLRLQA